MVAVAVVVAVSVAGAVAVVVALTFMLRCLKGFFYLEPQALGFFVSLPMVLSVCRCRRCFLNELRRRSLSLSTIVIHRRPRHASLLASLSSSSSVATLAQAKLKH